MTSHPKTTMALLDAGTPGGSREIYMRMPMVRLKLATPGLETSALAIELYSSKAIAGKELSLSSLCIVYLSFLNCDSLLI